LDRDRELERPQDPPLGAGHLVHDHAELLLHPHFLRHDDPRQSGHRERLRRLRDGNEADVGGEEADGVVVDALQTRVIHEQAGLVEQFVDVDTGEVNLHIAAPGEIAPADHQLVDAILARQDHRGGAGG
jgi:hypothetical protein